MDILVIIELSIIIVLCFSFFLLASVVLIYYVRRRYLLYLDIKSISQDELMLQSFQNHRENLRIKALISNFIIVIVLVEIVYSLSISFSYMPSLLEYFSTTLDWNYIRAMLRFDNIFSTLSTISYLCHLPILSLLLKVLWLIYLHSPYKYTIIRWTWYIVIRCVLLSIFFYLLNTSQYPIGWYVELIMPLIYTLMNTADLIIYLMYARRLYIQLKSREKEARWFKDRVEYRTARSLRLHYKIATILVAIAMCTTTINQNSYNFECILSFFIGYTIMDKVRDYYQYFYCFGFIIFFLLLNLNYLYIVSMMVFKNCKQKRQLTNVNNKIKPIVRNYHDTLYFAKY